MKVDQKTIAKKIGVSQATVSRVLGNSPRISAGTRRQVLRVARRLNYCPNGIAQMFSRGKHLFVGILAHSLTGSFWAEAIDGAEKAIIGAGRVPLISVTNGSAETLEMYLHQYRRYRVSGCLAFGFHTTQERNLLAEMHAAGIPVVCVCRDWSKWGYPSVCVSEQAVVSAALGHLLQLGHARIAYFGPESQRKDAFVAQLRAHGIKHELIIKSRPTLNENLVVLSNLFGGIGRPTAIFAYSDELAVVSLKAARRAGIRVPEDLSIVGVDDIPLASMVEPEITTVRQPQGEQGLEAYKLLNRIVAGQLGTGQVTMQVELIRRGSTCPLKTKEG